MTGEAHRPPAGTRHVTVDVVSTSKPVLGPERGTYRCDAELRVTEGSRTRIEEAHLVIQHPSGWMGVAAGFHYNLDPEVYPTFEARAEQACLWAMSAFRAEHDQVLSVFLLGTGAT